MIRSKQGVNFMMLVKQTISLASPSEKIESQVSDLEEVLPSTGSYRRETLQ